MIPFPAYYTLNNKQVPQLIDAIEAVSIRAEALGPPEKCPEGVQHLWRCSDAGGELFALWATELGDENVYRLPAGTIYLQLLPRAKTAPRRKRNEISAALERFDRAVIALGATKCV